MAGVVAVSLFTEISDSGWLKPKSSFSFHKASTLEPALRSGWSRAARWFVILA